MDSSSLTFWDHLDELRGALLRMAAVVVGCSMLTFALKDELFRLVLAPTQGSFLTYRLLGATDFHLSLMNTGLTEQFMVHLRTSLYAAVLITSPYWIFELMRFAWPGLYKAERRVALAVVGSAYGMFIVGTLVNYLLIFPLTVRFLGTYQVSAEVANMLTLQSYIDTLLGMNLVMGLVFELPVVAALLAKMGLLNSQMMSRYRRHAIVAIFVVAAIITPTTDAFTLTIVALPIYALYEVSILLVNNIK